MWGSWQSGHWGRRRLCGHHALWIPTSPARTCWLREPPGPSQTTQHKARNLHPKAVQATSGLSLLLTAPIGHEAWGELHKPPSRGAWVQEAKRCEKRTKTLPPPPRWPIGDWDLWAARPLQRPGLPLCRWGQPGPEAKTSPGNGCKHNLYSAAPSTVTSPLGEREGIPGVKFHQWREPEALPPPPTGDRECRHWTALILESRATLQRRLFPDRPSSFPEGQRLARGSAARPRAQKRASRAGGMRKAPCLAYLTVRRTTLVPVRWRVLRTGPDPCAKAARACSKSRSLNLWPVKSSSRRLWLHFQVRRGLPSRGRGRLLMLQYRPR